ncbi:unnamed protein product [Amoebophrya sp. A25]|nr:unnamed protein product [Amoebophrya sp. A25]|eukprot:GSA25T00004950001.1
MDPSASDMPKEAPGDDATGARLRSLDDLVAKLTAANEGVSQDRDREAKKAKLLERELLALRASTEELRKVAGEQKTSSTEASDVAQLRRELKAKTDECEGLAKDLQEAKQGVTPTASAQQSKSIDAILSADDGSGHVDKLRQVIKAQQEDVLRLREEIVFLRLQPVRVETVVQEKFVEVPTVDVKTVEVENVDKITVLIMKCRDLEHEILAKDREVADWKAKCERLEAAPPQIVPTVVESEDSGKIRELLSQLNSLQTETVDLKRRLIEQSEKVDRVEYVDREVYIEIPTVRPGEGEHERKVKEEQMQHLLSMKDDELARLRHDVTFHRESAQRLDRQLQEMQGLIQSRVVQSSTDAKVQDILRLRGSDRLPPMKRLSETPDGTCRYLFGSLVFDARAFGSDVVVSCEGAQYTLVDFLQNFGEQEFAKHQGPRSSPFLPPPVPERPSMGRPGGAGNGLGGPGGPTPPGFSYGGGPDMNGRLGGGPAYSGGVVPSAAPIYPSVKGDDQIGSLVSWVLGEPEGGTGAS